MRKSLPIAALVAATVAATSASARIAPEPRDCVLTVGPAQMTFTAFQEQKTHETFCRHVPDAGRTIIILDAHQSELRGMTLEIRIVRNVGQHEWNDDLDANTEFTLPAKKYLASNGTASFEYSFPRDGDYIALVRATSEDGYKEYIGQYFFSVGETIERFLAAAAMLVALSFVCFGLWGGKGEAAKVARGAFAGEGDLAGRARPTSRP